MLNLLHQATELKYDNEVEMHQKGTGARDGRQGIAGVRMAGVRSRGGSLQSEAR